MVFRKLPLLLALVGCAHNPNQGVLTADPPTETTELVNIPPAKVDVPPPTYSASDPIGKLADGAQKMDNLGGYEMEVTASKDGQAWFNQGLRLNYGFNHDEAARSFAMGAMVDPTCAMCYWGVALTLGPNYNVPMLPDRAATAWAALKKAESMVDQANPLEKALIGAMSTRYKSDAPLSPEAMAPYNRAYAAAMGDVARRFPKSDDAQVLYAEALMDANPWKLWNTAGAASPGTDEILTALKKVLDRNPQHPGANHYYIHAVEASHTPGLAVACADRLANLIPGAGHILHMPAHIYQRVGRYAEASLANQRAISADLEYIKKFKPPGYYPMYLAHNYGFLSFSASMEGKCETAVSAAQAAAKAMPPGMADMMPGMDFFAAEPYLAMVRCGWWKTILAEKRPDPKYVVMTGLWLHAQGMAHVATGDVDTAIAEYEVLHTMAESAPPEMPAGNNSARQVLAVAAKILQARIATVKKWPNALTLWGEAVVLADGLAYSEPDDWYYPVRHYQGQALLEARKYKLAEAAFRQDLDVHPSNGWALWGLYESLEGLHRGRDATEIKHQFDEAWKGADRKLDTAAY
jgi:tetratricopeptide (TPR) repeat protein